jgi:hypothetical protein
MDNCFGSRGDWDLFMGISLFLTTVFWAALYLLEGVLSKETPTAGNRKM